MDLGEIGWGGVK